MSDEDGAQNLPFALSLSESSGLRPTRPEVERRSVTTSYVKLRKRLSARVRFPFGVGGDAGDEIRWGRPEVEDLFCKLFIVFA